ncbi:MAG: hypothetical protein WEA58_10615 [Balneolaceae bacterium]
MSQLADILLISSGVTFIVGILALFIKPIRIKDKTRYYFLVAFMLLGLGLTFGWSDFVQGLNDGVKGVNCDSCDEKTEQVD